MTKWYTFEVRPTHAHADFPLDMLRYDCCYPKSECDSSTLRYCTEEVLQTPVVIMLSSHRVPNADRWASFGWEVTKLKLEKKQL